MSDRGVRRSRAAACAILLAVLPGCALFKPERVAIRSTSVETLPPTPIVPGATVPGQPGATPGAPGVVFQPGTSNAANSGKANYASDEGVTADVIRIGTIQPMDGPAAQLGRPLYRTTQAYVNALNARGGINGRLVELHLQTACINCEDENKLAAKALVEQKHVFAIVNTYMNTYAFSAALGYLVEKRVPLIQGWSGTGSESITWGSKQTPWNVYYTVRNDDGVRVFARWLQAALTQWAKARALPADQDCAQHPYWVATVGLQTTQDERRAEEFAKVWRSFGSAYQVRNHQSVAAEEEAVTRMDSFISAMKDSDACGVFSASNITLVFGMQAAKRQAWKVPWVAKSAWGRAATDNCGSSCDGGFTDNNGWGWPEIMTPQMRQYHDVMSRYYPDSTDDAQTLGGWIGMMAFEYGAGRLGADLTRRGLIDVVGNLRNFETGIGARISTSSADHLGMSETMMLQICRNRFYRVSGWLSATTTPPGAVESPCGWGY
jgi:ABC-type branched-subunit amino acid transport system substrate-binding protein